MFPLYLHAKNPCGPPVSAEYGDFLSHRPIPRHHPNFPGIFPTKNHPFWCTHHLWKPPYVPNQRSPTKLRLGLVTLVPLHLEMSPRNVACGETTSVSLKSELPGERSWKRPARWPGVLCYTFHFWIPDLVWSCQIACVYLYISVFVAVRTLPADFGGFSGS